jgi:hypothetical protein
MKLILNDGSSQTIDLPSAPDELRIDRSDLITLATALLLAYQGENYNETIAEIKRGKTAA